MNSIIETTNLTKDFSSRRVVDSLNLSVYEGDIYGFLGPNGAGKSTTIRMLTGLVRPTSGGAKVLGFDIRSQLVNALQGVGALVESPAFYKYLSARENLRIFSSLSGSSDSKRIDQVLETVGLLDRANDKVKVFSHGMQQRLGIACAMLPNPKLIILDEPTNGLDPQGMKDVRELILRLANEEHVTVFLSSHLLHEVEQVCTRVGILNQGKLVAEGDVKQLLRAETERIELKVGGIDKAMDIFAGLEWVQVMPEPEAFPGGYGRLIVCTPAERIPEMNRLLVNAGVEVFCISPIVSTLEDLFFELMEEGKNAVPTPN